MDLYNLTKEEQCEILKKRAERNPKHTLPVWSYGIFQFMAPIDQVITHVMMGSAIMLPCEDGSWGVDFDPRKCPRPPPSKEPTYVPNMDIYED